MSFYFLQAFRIFSLYLLKCHDTITWYGMYFHIILGTQWVGHSKLWCFCSLSIISSSSVSGTSVIHMLTLSNWSSYYLFSHIFHLFVFFVLFLGRFLQHCLQTLPLNLLANFQFQRTITYKNAYMLICKHSCSFKKYHVAFNKTYVIIPRKVMNPIGSKND